MTTPTGSSRRIIWFGAAVHLLVGCGGPSEPAAPPPLPLVLSFAKIAGEWQGTLTEIRTTLRYAVSVTFLASAPRGGAVGSVVYHTRNLLGADCNGTLVADSAAGDSYWVQEKITGPCTNSSLVLDHQVSADSIKYESYSTTGNICCRTTLGRKP